MHFYNIGLLFFFCPLYIYAAASDCPKLPILRALSGDRMLYSAAEERCPSPRTKSETVFVGCNAENTTLRSTLKRCVLTRKFGELSMPVKFAQQYHIIVHGATAEHRDRMLTIPAVDNVLKSCDDNAVTVEEVLNAFNEQSDMLPPIVSILQINIEMRPVKRASRAPAPVSLPLLSKLNALVIEPKKETIFVQNGSVLNFDEARLFIMGQYPSNEIEEYLKQEEMRNMINDRKFELLRPLLEHQFSGLKAAWFSYEKSDSRGLSLSS